jgi:hypothetical protein
MEGITLLRRCGCIFVLSTLFGKMVLLRSMDYSMESES